MPKKSSTSKSKDKAARKTSSGKAAKKKTTKKKITKKKTATKKAIKKKTSKKKTAKKKTVRTPAGPRITRKSPTAQQSMIVEPGPTPVGIPPVEEPALNQEAVGTVTHYYGHLEVAVVQVNKGSMNTGDTIHIQGHTTDFTQQIESMEYEHQHVDSASAGQSVGIKVKAPVREHDIVYRVR